MIKEEKPLIELLEGNDCTVRALSQAYDISYQDAHKICERYGREFRRGFHFQAKLATDLKMILVENATNKTVKQVLATVASNYKTYLCLVSGHIFCIKDGKPQDGQNNLSKKVNRLWEIRK